MADTAHKFSVNLSAAPEELSSIYSSSFSRCKHEGMSDDDADKFAAQQLYLAGWFSTTEGWQKRGPDVRDKVNLRRAELQPNGNYIVRDLDVFYSNAVKADGQGNPIVFSKDDIAERVKNTNAFIAEGGQKPGLTKGHPTSTFAAPSMGECINWRLSPKQGGAARVDVVNVPPDVVGEWKQGKWTGLSAGLLRDADGSNHRFSHVALLGSTPQALSHLPQAVVYEADGVMFSAEPPEIEKPVTTTKAPPSSKGQPMKTDFSAAFAAITEGLSRIQAEFTAEQAPKDGDFAPKETALDEKSLTKNKAVLGDKGTEETEYHAAPAAAVDTVNRAEFDALKAENERLNKAANGIAGKFYTAEFTAFVKEAQKNGHNFDADSKIALFTALASRGQTEAVELLRQDILKSPKNPLVAAGQVFDSESNGPINTRTVSGSNKHNLGVTFSAEDQKIGDAIGLGTVL